MYPKTQRGALPKTGKHMEIKFLVQHRTDPAKPTETKPDLLTHVEAQAQAQTPPASLFISRGRSVKAKTRGLWPLELRLKVHQQRQHPCSEVSVCAQQATKAWGATVTGLQTREWGRAHTSELL